MSTWKTDKPVNGYKCTKGHTVVVRDLTKGVTPFIIACPECKRNGNPSVEAQSMFYRVPASWWDSAEYEFYKPVNPAKLSPAERQHVQQGGLIMRAVGEPDKTI